MHQPKLILIEGIPGSGKTSAAQFVSRFVEASGLRLALFLEANLDHPADYESVAWLSAGDYGRLLEQYPESRDALEELVVRRGEDRFISYRRLPNSLPQTLLDTIRLREIYELPLDEHRRLALLRWQDFSRKAAADNLVYIFECCFWQNPITVMLGRHNADRELIRSHIQEMSAIVAPLDPLLVYLDPGNVEETLRHVAGERPVEWLHGVIGYTTGQEFGKANGLSGFEGMVRFYEAMRDLEAELLPAFPGRALAIKAANQNWPDSYQKIETFLAQSLQ